MSLADEFRAIADECRNIPSEFGLREHAVSLVFTRTTSGLPWDGDEVSTEVAVTHPGGGNPKVRFPSQKELALGLMSIGSVTVGPITPEYLSGALPGGLDRSLFNGSQLEIGDMMQVKITGPQHPTGCLYRIRNSNVDRALRVTWICVPVEET